MRDPEIMARVKAILNKVEEVAPGKSVELRIPPYAAIQCVEGTTHRRGTPPNVVEMNAETLFALIEARTTWAKAVQDGVISASGERSDLSALFAQITRLNKGAN